MEYLDAAADRLVYLAFRENRIGEIYTLEHGREIRLTHANDGIYDRCAVSTPQPLEVDTGGPLPVQGGYSRRWPTFPAKNTQPF